MTDRTRLRVFRVASFIAAVLVAAAAYSDDPPLASLFEPFPGSSLSRALPIVMVALSVAPARFVVFLVGIELVLATMLALTLARLLVAVPSPAPPTLEPVFPLAAGWVVVCLAVLAFGLAVAPRTGRRRTRSGPAHDHPQKSRKPS